MGRLFFVVFLVTPLIEIACFILIGQAIGLWPTLAGVVVMAVVGALVLRVQGLSLVNEIRQSVGNGQLPARALAEAMMVFIAGLLLLLPGYFSDVVGLLLLIPGLRGAIYHFLRSRVQVVSTTATYSYGTDPAQQPRQVPDGTVDLDSDEWRPR